MGSRTFPKEGVQKLKEIIRDLKSQLREQERQNRLLRDELDHLMKPSRVRKPHVDRTKMTMDEWRKDFVDRVKREMGNK